MNTEWPNERILLEIKQTQDWINFWKLSIEKAQSKCDELQSELDRRALAAYWLAHPELIPLNPNDQLLSDTIAGYPTEIIKVNIEDNTCDVRWWVFDRTLNPHYWTDVPMKRVQDMRRAYLESEKVL